MEERSLEISGEMEGDDGDRKQVCKIAKVYPFCLLKSLSWQMRVCEPFLADRTNGRAIATVLRLSSSVA